MRANSSGSMACRRKGFRQVLIRFPRGDGFGVEKGRYQNNLLLPIRHDRVLYSWPKLMIG